MDTLDSLGRGRPLEIGVPAPDFTLAMVARRATRGSRPQTRVRSPRLLIGGVCRTCAPPRSS